MMKGKKEMNCIIATTPMSLYANHFNPICKIKKPYDTVDMF